jgi:hypothetical protein
VRRSRDVEFECAARFVSEPVQDVQRGFHFAEQGRELFDQTQSRFGWGHAASGSVEQAHAEFRLETAHGNAQTGRRDAADARGIAKAAGTGDRNEGGKIVEFHGHCSKCLTTRAI